MQTIWRAIGEKAADRSGLTVMEVLIALGVFMLASVGIVGLFVTASVLHADAINRRTTSMIAESLLAEVKGTPLRSVYAKTHVHPGPLGGPGDTGGTIYVDSLEPEPEYQAADFYHFPLAAGWDVRITGFLLVEGADGAALVPDELVYYENVNTQPLPSPDSFTTLTRDILVAGGGVHPDGSRVLQPRTWNFCISDGDIATAANDPLEETGSEFDVYDASPAGWPPDEGYLVIDEEWMPYLWDAVNARFIVRDLDNDGNPERGAGDTTPAQHDVGAPVTIAREHARYPGFYYTVQFYPANATGAESKVIISVAYGRGERLRRAHFFHSIYTPATY
jgi:hypothetical protein